MFYLDLFSSLDRHRVRYVLVGGLAMNLHGVPRTTMDVDLVIALDRENQDAFLAATSELGLTPVLPVALADLFDADKRREWAQTKNMIAFAMRPQDTQGPTVDVLIEPRIAIDDALRRVLWRDIQNVRVPLAAVEDMIRLKENTGRLQDQSDIEHLRRILGKPI
jgi:hypothetical protein